MNERMNSVWMNRLKIIKQMVEEKWMDGWMKSYWIDSCIDSDWVGCIWMTEQ